MFGKKKHQKEMEQPVSSDTENTRTDKSARRLHLPSWNGAAVRQSLHTAGFRHGSYSAGLTALVLAILIVINLLAGSLPTNARMLDMTSNRLFEIGDTTKTTMEALDKDVQLTIVAQPDTLDTRIERLIDAYAALSSHITVQTLDPVLHPADAQKLGVEDGTVVVSCEDTGETRNIPFSDIITHTYSMYTYDAVEDSFDGEGQLTAAIVNVSSPSNHVIYTTQGHGEASLGSTIQDALTKANLQIDSVNLVVDGGIPEDCGLLLIYAPQKDFDSSEIQTIQDWMAQGGHVMVLLGQSEQEQPNLNAWLKTYGMQRENGYIADAERYYSTGYDIFPEISTGTAITKDLSSDALTLVYNAVGLTEVEPTQENVTLDTVLRTSANGYLMTLDSQTAGQYTLGALATQDIAQPSDTTDTETSADTAEDSTQTEEETTTVQATLCVLPATLIDDSILNQFSNLSNQELFVNAVTINFDDVSNISIPAKSLSTSYNLITNAGAWGMLYIAIIPLGVLGAGLIHWLRRRRRV